MKQIKGTQLSAGIQYTFLNTELKPVAGDLPDFVKEDEIKSLVSMPGIIVEFDSRDNIFTPNKGIRLNTNLSWSDPIFGSDYNYLHLTAFGHAFHPLSRKLIGGLRYEMQQVFDDPPFYLKPYLNLRGIPIARYQGNIFSVIESEVRWDFVTRWSAVFFAGTGKAYDTWNEFDDSSWHTSGGGGFRYLIARKFGLRMGVDLARGPEQWAYYIVFGSSWLK
jgi:outer membrane protein assembly factor BamA